MKSVAFVEGKFVSLDDAKISIMTHAFLYGTGIFEGIRAYYNKEQDELFIFRAREHFRRFENSCRLLKIELPMNENQLLDLTVELLQRCDFHEDVYIRPVGYKSSKRIGLKLDDQNDFLLFAVPMGSYLSQEHPLRLMISSWRRIEDNAIPARSKVNGSYVNLALAANEARENGFDEAILLNEDGSVSEAAGMNFFMVREGTLITPPVTDNVLEGITRNTVLKIATSLQIPYLIRTVDRSELYVADELFLCGTGAEISAAGSVDNRQIGTGKIGAVTSAIQKLYFEIVRGEKIFDTEWLTPVLKSVRELNVQKP
jgi:branched-chain amino acid aminotransferase